jgi:hypothetical protein
MKLLVPANNKTIVLNRIKPAPAFYFITYIVSIFKKLFPILLLLGATAVIAQPNADQQAEYKKVIQERTAKIVNTLGIADSGEFNKVSGIVAEQYFSLNNIQEQNKQAVADLKKQSLPAEELTAALNKEAEKKMSTVKQLHADFIAQLEKSLSGEQLEKIKDGMTYRILPITYGAYLDMLPDLTKEQKDKIYSWLKEARELAMDAESSDKKHEVFGKYKGKINNYLSAAGYDMKKEGEAWQKRIKEREAKTKEQKSS